MKNIQYTFTILIMLCCMAVQTQAQLNVTSGQTANDLVTNILGGGVTFSNAALTSSGNSAGVFTNGSTTNIGIDEGILLSSGSVFDAPGPNNSSNTTTNNNAPGDADLDALVGGSTLDAVSLEFDFEPEGTSVNFNYTFASDEYDEYFCSNFNDGFAFLVSGPNPGGGSYNNENIAIIPSTVLPVSINNIGFQDCNGIDNSSQFVSNNSGLTIEYDGFTLVFTAALDLVPCQSYHIKLVIADRFDRSFDSGVFIEKGSFTTNNVQAVAAISSPSCPGGSDGSIDVSINSGIAPFTYVWNNGDVTQDRSNVGAGSYTVIVSDALGCSIESFTFEVLDGVDTTPPDLVCNDAILVLDASGSATLAAEDIAVASDLCGLESLSIDITSFQCILGDVDVTATAVDIYGNTSVCTVTVSVVGDDADCDNVADACDLCAGGDDRVDNDGDGNPDCAVPPSFDDIIDAWKCSSKKVYMCHVPPGNPGNAHTICVSKNAINAHLAHGDYLGPCGNASCDAARGEVEVSVRSDHSDIIVFPNPATNQLFINNDHGHYQGYVYLRNSIGQIVLQHYLIDGVNTIDVSSNIIANGIYMISVGSDNTLIQKVIINK